MSTLAEHASPHADPSMSSPRWVLWLSTLALVVFFGWASIAEIDQITRAPGKVIASSRSQLIQTTDGGVLERLEVREGDRVEKGALLAVLDSTRATASVGEVRARAVGLGAAVVRLRAEVLDELPNFSEVDGTNEHPELVAAQRTLFERRQTALREDLGGLDRTLGLVRKELRMLEPLLKAGDVSEAEVLKLRRQAAEIQAQRVTRKNHHFQDAQAELARAEEELASARQMLAQRQDALDQTQLFAPMGGIVKDIRVTTIGGVVMPGEEILQIVPDDEELVIEAKVRPADIGHLRPGLPASVKVDAYDFTIYGALGGTVRYISADTLDEDVRLGEEPYYRVRVVTDSREFSSRPDADIEFQAGMTATIEVKTGENTVLNYLTKPLIKTLDESLGER